MFDNFDENTYFQSLKKYNVEIKYVNGKRLIKALSFNFNPKNVIREFLSEVEGFIKGIYDAFPNLSESIKTQCEKVYHSIHS